MQDRRLSLVSGTQAVAHPQHLDLQPQDGEAVPQNTDKDSHGRSTAWWDTLQGHSVSSSMLCHLVTVYSVGLRSIASPGIMLLVKLISLGVLQHMMSQHYFQSTL